MNKETYEYMVEFRGSFCERWTPLGSATTDINEAKRQLEKNRLDYPRFKYRLVMRTVSPWCECTDSKIVGRNVKKLCDVIESQKRYIEDITDELTEKVIHLIFKGEFLVADRQRDFVMVIREKDIKPEEEKK